jgi:hypothetical protein
MPRLENWFVSELPNDPYMAPELKRQVLCGNVFGHPNFPDYSDVTTSAIEGIEMDSDAILTASGSEYTLGKPKEDYEKLFPNAKERLIKSLRGG